QEVKEKTKEGQSKLVEPKPQESWKANKEYDDEGNQIKLGSTYSWSFSSCEKEIAAHRVYSLMKSFRCQFHSALPSTLDKTIVDFFAHDYIGANSFLHDDFFMNNWHDRMEEMEKMLRKSDSIHTFFLDGFREKKPSESKSF